LRIFWKRVLRRTFDLKAEVTGGWKKLHDKELHSLGSSPNIRATEAKSMKQAMVILCMGDEK
jgi:hypothetical protein